MPAEKISSSLTTPNPNKINTGFQGSTDLWPMPYFCYKWINLVAPFSRCRCKFSSCSMQPRHNLEWSMSPAIPNNCGHRIASASRGRIIYIPGTYSPPWAASHLRVHLGPITGRVHCQHQFHIDSATALYLTGQDKTIKNCSPDHDRGGVKIQKKVWIAYSEFSHLWADHLAGPSNFSDA